MVAYEPMNEPVADDPEQWNQLLERLIDSIRVQGTGKSDCYGIQHVAVGKYFRPAQGA